MFSARSQSYGMRCTLLEAGTNPLHKPIWKLLGVIVCAVILSVFTAASAFSQGTPTLAGSITGQGQQAAGVLFLDVKLSNTGTDTAQNVKLTQVLFRTLGGTGTASYNTSLSPALPLSVGTLAAGANTTVRIFLNLPSTIT